jgi:hypothetical protein
VGELTATSTESTPDRQAYELVGSDDYRATLWYDSPGGQLVGTGRLDPVAVAALPLAMARGETLVLEGVVTAELLRNLEEYVDAWARWRPTNFSAVAIRAGEEREAAPVGTDAVLGFSGGVDSVYELLAHHEGWLGRRSLRPSLALLMGGMDFAVGDVAVATAACDHARPILDEVGTELALVNSNWRELPLPLEWTFGAGIASVLHLFAGRAGFGVIAPDFPYASRVLPWGTNPVTNPRLGHAGFTIGAGSMGPGRTEKCMAIGAWEVVREHLRVCTAEGSAGGNCGRCRKCVRTKLNFHAAGIGEIAALGPLDPDDIDRVEIRNHDLLYLDDILSYPELPDRYRQPLARRVRRERARLRWRGVRREGVRRVRATPVVGAVAENARLAVRRRMAGGR